ncbi:zinc finger protein 862-like [Hypomesus transpacificus]|uniref:zinc finger protein 862-like n=1 Tax=Hypomesus transpacificus TaxID=137520 RepID=UPI001F0825A5|nr:zinc finger protein 862-like [Hypomesus transpacificus]
MATRFCDFSSGVLHASKLVDITSWPKADTREDFGDADVDCLMKHFGPQLASSGADLDLIPDQWTFLKSSLYQQHENMEQMTWPEINQRLGGQCPDFLQLVDIVLCIPSSTADCERGFNLMKQVKSVWRSGLRSDTLSDLLTVQLTSPNIEDFDPDSAIQLWHQASVRRPDFMERGAKKRKTQLEDDSETSEEEDDSEQD